MEHFEIRNRKRGAPRNNYSLPCILFLSICIINQSVADEKQNAKQRPCFLFSYRALRSENHRREWWLRLDAIEGHDRSRCTIRTALTERIAEKPQEDLNYDDRNEISRKRKRERERDFFRAQRRAQDKFGGAPSPPGRARCPLRPRLRGPGGIRLIADSRPNDAGMFSLRVV